MSGSIRRKAKRVLHIVLVIFVALAMRVWYLTTIAYEEHVQMARKPQMRTVVEQAHRGTIRDRFNTPLSVNKIQYDVALCYDPIRRLPRTEWRKDASGHKFKALFRQEYVGKLCSMLADTLDLNAKDIEDLLYSKAALFPTSPITLKENVSEETFYQMKMIERKWPGLELQITSRRHYPEEEIASHLVGYMGAISDKEHLAIHDELEILREFLKARDQGLPALLPKGFSHSGEVRERLEELEAKAYTINSHVGKAGVESTFDEDLRGFFGKKKYEVDIQGHYLRELPESFGATPGRRLLLSISTELQAFAESLLAQSEISREEHFAEAGLGHSTVPPPWIKGGAIVAMLPDTGEIVALASYPRFNPNDFITRSPLIHKWLEDSTYIGDIWDGALPLERDFSGARKPPHIPEKQDLTWEYFLSTVLSAKSSIRKALEQIGTVKHAVTLQMTLDDLLTTLPLEEAIEKLPELRSIPAKEDKLLALDLLRVAVHHQLFTPELIPYTEHISLSEYRKANQAVAVLQKEAVKQLKHLFHTTEFPQWREKYFKAYLKEKRDEEKRQKRYQKPYIEYLEEIENLLFQDFLSREQHPFLLKQCDCLKDYLTAIPPTLVSDYLKTMRRFDELKRPLLGRYYLPAKPGRQALEKDLARHFYPATGFGFARSYAFQETVPQGSIFKVVTALESLSQYYAKTGELNPLTIVDEYKDPKDTSGSAILGYTSSGSPITRFYKGGRLPRSSKRIGKIGLLEAMEQSSNIYFSLLASEVIADPLDLRKAAKKLGLGSKTGIALTGEASGLIPTDVADNLSGLYSLAIGQHSLTVTPLQTATLLSALVNHGELLKPQIARCIVGLEPSLSQFSSLHYRYAQLLNLIGIYFPFFTEAETKHEAPYLWKMQKEVKDQLSIPEEVQKTLISSMHRVINGEKGGGHISRIRALQETPRMRATYQEIQPSLIGKTGTAEILYRPCLDKEYRPILCKHIWFAGAAMDEKLEKGELVVVVSLRYGDYGKETIPLAAEIVKKWREIQAR